MKNTDLWFTLTWLETEWENDKEREQYLYHLDGHILMLRSHGRGKQTPNNAIPNGIRGAANIAEVEVN